MIFLNARWCLWALCALVFQACTPKKECYVVCEAPTHLTTINIIDRNGMSETVSTKDRLSKYEGVDWFSPQPYEKVLRVYSKDYRGEIHAYITSYYENTLPKQYLEVVNARAKGAYQEWHENGGKKLSATVIGGEADLTTEAQKNWVFDGLSEVWDECGNIQARFCYCKGVLEGESLYYHANGNVWKRVPFCQGNIQGTYVVFLENGDLFQSGEYLQGKRNGKSVRYWPDGAVAAEEIFQSDRLMEAQYWGKDGGLLCEVVNGNGTRAVFGKEAPIEFQQVQHGIVEGEVKRLGANGEVLRLWHVSRGVKHGEEIEFYPMVTCRGTPQKMISINWWEGKIQGITRTWYPNGVQESQREMAANKKNGVLTAWYIDGSLMLMEEYDQDKIVRGEYYKKGSRIPISEIKEGNGIATLYDYEGHFMQRVNYVKGIIEP